MIPWFGVSGSMGGKIHDSLGFECQILWEVGYMIPWVSSVRF